MDIRVYAHWAGMEQSAFIGLLSAQYVRGKNALSFAFDPDWLKMGPPFSLDPDIGPYPGPQYPNGKELFGMANDTMPDRWGRMLMKRRAAMLAKDAGLPAPTLTEMDYLLGVQDASRLGALRFKLEEDGPFMAEDNRTPVPPITSIRELQAAAAALESDDVSSNPRKWLEILVAPGASLGGAHPKASVMDEQGGLWIAKFPSNSDVVDKGAWEYLAYRLAIEAGVEMSESKLMKVSGNRRTFLTRRFDRQNGERLHFASAMTMTGNDEPMLRAKTASYLDLAEFIQFNGSNIKADLQQLWRRIVFSIAVSNTDDHLRNHGFILGKTGWRLSPAFDINPNHEGSGLSLNIDQNYNSLDFELAKSVGKYFQLTLPEMEGILGQVLPSVRKWQGLAKEIGIGHGEVEMMGGAFRVA